MPADEVKHGAGSAVEKALLLFAALFISITTYIFCARSMFYADDSIFLLDLMTVQNLKFLFEFAVYYPPLFPFFQYVFFKIFALPYPIFMILHLLFYFGGAVYVGLIAKDLWGRDSALLCALAFLLAPGISLYSKASIIETTMMLFAPAFVFHFRRLSANDGLYHAFFAGLFLSAGTLSKWTFPIYLLPALYFLPDVLRRKSLLLRLVLFAIPLVPSLLWYIFKLNWIGFLGTTQNHPSGFESYWDRLTEYLSSYLPLDHIGTGGLIALLLALVIGIAYRSMRTKAITLALGIIVPVLILSYFVHIEPRYLLVTIYIFSIMIGVIVAAPTRYKGQLKTLVIALLLLCFLYANLGDLLGLGDWNGFVSNRLQWRLPGRELVLDSILETRGIRCSEQDQRIEVVTHPYCQFDSTAFSSLRMAIVGNLKKYGCLNLRGYYPLGGYHGYNYYIDELKNNKPDAIIMDEKCFSSEYPKNIEILGDYQIWHDWDGGTTESVATYDPQEMEYLKSGYEQKNALRIKDKSVYIYYKAEQQ